MSVISCRNVSKIFRRHAGPKLAREHLKSLLTRRTRHDSDFYALRDVSFEVNDGESLAIIGGNGAGKSTLLSLIAGLTCPDRGSLSVTGQVAALLQLGSGFHPDLTGAENVAMNASLLGFSRKQVRALFDSIVEFSGIGDFINEPLRTYSSGMVVRLAFSVAINLNPDILIIDEVLAVGDIAFQEKCNERIRALRRSGKTFVCVSHALPVLLELCDRAIWLDRGELMLSGDIKDVVSAYEGRLVSGTRG
jgi:ABC-type polysaccharide/polyol phosphate transport system ATPase subunit